ncbi:hypothetical protein KC19_11G115300 [Ceratodon purpureus]|uniref:Uncharacterized protein n=1 Tax=Ceratodon purpureus TaxID=3225 RepID=A0A8T0GHM2_CERPU|nr:hypothetical protein KC19_11G115300 [Ceratodon purpureus]
MRVDRCAVAGGDVVICLLVVLVVVDFVIDSQSRWHCCAFAVIVREPQSRVLLLDLARLGFGVWYPSTCGFDHKRYSGVEKDQAVTSGPGA